MVVIRSQTFRIKSPEKRIMSDNESEVSFPELFTREQMTDLDNDDLLNRERGNETDVIDQRFHEMNRQIGEITNLVLALTQQISPNPRERNGPNMTTTSANSRSDNFRISFAKNFVAL